MRLFVAADLSEDQRASLRLKVVEARQAAPFEMIRWLPEENWHATMAFIGDREESELPDVVSIIDRLVERPLTLRVQPHRIQSMPHRSQPRLLALKAIPEPPIQEFYFWLNQALGIKDRHRHFQFHVTVARFRELRGDDARELAEAIKDLSEMVDEMWQVPSITLYESELSQSGATYRSVKTWPCAL